MDRNKNDEEDPMEKELAEDATWKRIQRNTFTRWANNHISSVNKHIEDLEQDLSDGLRLISLIEVLSGKRINKFNKRPTVRAQKLENVGIVLRFLTTDERMKIVNIDSTDVVDSNLKLILGLVWTLILHYSISTPMWEGEEDELDEKGNKKKETPKHRLLRWINNKLPELRITNFTSDWNSGIALAALVDAIAPGLFPDWQDLKSENPLEIARKALALADKWLSCPQLITAEDLTNPKIDELSMMTYLSNFPNAKLKEDAPLTQRCNPNRVRVYGAGVQKNGVVCGAQTTFTVETFSAGEGKLDIKVLDSKNKEIAVNIKFNEDRSKTYTCSYTALNEGQYKVIVNYAGKEVPKSPFEVNVEGIAGDANKVTASGPGLEKKGVQVGKQTYFDVDTSSAGLGQVEVNIIEPDGKPSHAPLRIVAFEQNQNDEQSSENKKPEENKISRRQKEQQPELVKPSKKKQDNDIKLPLDVPTKYHVEYVPQKAGSHKIHIRFAGKELPKSPFEVNIAPPCDSTKVKAFGRGLQLSGIRVGDSAEFQVFTEGAGQGEIQVFVQGPDGKNIPVEMSCIDIDIKSTKKQNQKPTVINSKDGPIIKDIASGETYHCVYKPVAIGKHTVVVQYGEQEILRSPFEVNVSKAIDSKIIAYGPGLKGGIAQSPAVFTVDTRGDESTLGFTIEGPSQAKITCKDNGDGSAEVSYLPTAPGEYGIHILSNGEDIPNSPYVAQILPRTDYNPELVKVDGKGVQPNGVPRNVPVKFQVDSRKAGIAPTEVLVMNCETLKNIPIKCEKRRGSILELDSNSKKKATVETQVKKTKSSTVKQNSLEKEGEFIDCEYVAKELGKHIVQVNFGGVAVPGSPFKVNVGELGQPDKVKVFGPGVENGLLPGSKTSFTIDARKAGIGEISANVVELRSGRKVPINLINNNDDTYTVEYSVDTLGSYRVEVCLDGKSSGGTPITVRAAEPLDKSLVKILKFNNTAFLNTPNTFVVDTREIKDKKDIQVKCELTCSSGKKKETKVEKQEDGTHLVTFKPDEKGLSLINVLCDNQSINDKPLKINVEEGFDEKKILVFGSGLKQGNVGEYNEFTIDTRNAGFAPLNLAIEGPDEAEMTCQDNGDGTYSCKYKPELEGLYEIQIKFGNKEVSGSPFVSNVKTKIDLSKVKIEGPGVEEKVLASLPTHININAKDVGKNCKPNVEIHGPDGKKCDSKMQEKDGIFCVEYTPEEIGKYQVTCNFNNTPVKGTPITVNSMPTGNPKKCILREKIENLMKVGEENCVTINTKEAGKGNITCKITSLNKPKSITNSKNEKNVKKIIEEEKVCEEIEKKVKVKVQDNKDGTFSVYYRVDEPGDYKMDLKFGGQTIPNGVHSFTVLTSEEETETTTTTTKTKDIKKNEEKTTTNSTKTTKKKTVIKTESYEEEITTEYRIVELKNVPIPKITHTKKQIKTEEKISSLNKLVGTVKLPNGEIDKATIVDNHDNTISVQYQPKMEGEHQLVLTCDGENIQGSPFRFYVNKLSSSKVTAFGPGLTHGIAGEPCHFKVFTKDAGSGGLKISIEGPSKAIIDSQDDGSNTVLVAYTPPTPGEYRICISFGGQPINGSPFTPKITGEGKQRSAISVSGSSEIKLKITETYTKEDRLISTIVTPSGIEEPCYLKKITETGQLAISFTPRESGEHLVHVKKNDVPLLGSPFKVNVLPKEIGNASKVKITGSGHKFGKTMIDNSFTIDTREAGYGAISLSMEGPSKAEIVSNETEPGLMKISYKAKQPGYYLMNLKFADSHVSGSPFTIEITGAGEQYQRENLLKETKNLNEHKMGSVCKMTFTISQAITQEKLYAFVTSPSGKKNEAIIKPADQSGKPNNTHVVEFTPNETGEHTIEIFYNKTNSTHIPGSPFKFTVGQLQNAGGANSVRAFGSGLEGGIVGQKGKFIINTREAGAGALGITMEGPGKAILELNEKTDELTYVGSYLTDKAGEYRLAIKYNNQHISQSPFRIWVMPEQDLAKKIVLEGLSTKTSSIVNKATTMQIRLNSVILNQKNINQTTTKKSTSTTSSSTTTTTITKTTTESSNQDNELIAKLVSPSGKEEICFLTEIDEKECVIQFVPKEPGPHQLHVRLNGVHVSNSPFNFFVRDDQNLNKQENSKKEVIKENKEIKEAKKTLVETTKKTEKIEHTVISCTKTGVKLTGAGLTPGLVKCGQKTEFIVDTTNAPMGKLNVKVDGPYKAQINLSLCDLGYKASYTVEGPGEYNVQVKYNDIDITGSPYKVVVDGNEKTTKNLGQMKVN